MKQQLKPTVSITAHTIGCVVCAGTVLLLTASTQAQNLFVSNYANGGPIYQYAPDGTQSVFDSGLPYYEALAFSSAGNLYAGVQNTGAIYKITPGGVRTTFATGFNGVCGSSLRHRRQSIRGGSLAAHINKIQRGRSPKTTFASGLSDPEGLGFQHGGNPVRGGSEAATYINTRRAERKARSPPDCQ